MTFCTFSPRVVHLLPPSSRLLPARPPPNRCDPPLLPVAPHSHVSPLETDLKAQIMTRRSRFSLNHPAHTHQVPSMAAQTVYCQDVCVRVHALTSAPQIPASPPRSICCHTLGCRRPLVITAGTYTQDAAGLHFLQRDLLQIKVKINLLRTAASTFYFFSSPRIHSDRLYNHV